MAFGVLSAPGLERVIQEKGVHLGKLGEGATWRPHTVIWMPEVNPGSWVLGDETHVARGG